MPAEFLSTPSARRATDGHRALRDQREISIHALREEGDCSRLSAFSIILNFYPRPPGGGRPTAPPCSRRLCGHFYPRPPRGGRPRFLWLCLYTERFLSTPSARRATTRRDVSQLPQGISIHALREEGDQPTADDFNGVLISIHALREEGDSVSHSRKACCSISIHALREEGDALGCIGGNVNVDFYPRPPRGGRRCTDGQPYHGF